MAIRGRRAPFPQIIKTRIQFAAPASTAPIGKVIRPVGAFASQAAVNLARRLVGHIAILRRETFSVAAPPIGKLVVPRGQFAAQAATNFAHRPLFQPNPNTPVVPRPRTATLKLPFLPRVPDASDTRRAARQTEILSAAWNSLLRAGYIRPDGLDYSIRSGAFEATRAPRQEDDESIRAQVGMAWVNTSTKEIWFCVSNSPGAAVWKGPY